MTTVIDARKARDRNKMNEKDINEMSDFISRKSVSAWLDNMGYPKLADMVMDGNRFPSAQPERKMGKWISKPGVYIAAYCSLCDYELRPDDTNFCPNCGADMGCNDDNDFSGNPW